MDCLLQGLVISCWCCLEFCPFMPSQRFSPKHIYSLFVFILCFYLTILTRLSREAYQLPHLPFTMTAFVSVLTSFPDSNRKSCLSNQPSLDNHSRRARESQHPAQPDHIPSPSPHSPLSQVYMLKSSCMAIRNVPVPATPEVVAMGTGSCNILSGGKRQRTDKKSSGKSPH